MPIRFPRFVFLLLGALASFSARALDVNRFELLKGIYYYQVQEGAALLQTNNAYRFSAQVWADVVGDVLASSVYTSKSDRLDLLPENDGDPFRYKDKFDIPFNLENNYPDGSYTLVIRTLHDGDRSMVFSLTGQLYPAAPVLNNYDAMQALPFNEYNEISWQPFVGASTNDFIQLQIEDASGNNVWETSDYGENGALNGLTTRTILPAGTLTPGAIYTGTLRFVKVVQNAARSYPLVHGTVGYFARTEFPVRPVSTAVNPLIDRVQLWRTTSAFEDEFGITASPPFFAGRVDAVTSNQIANVGLTLPNNNLVTFATNQVNDQFDLSDLEVSKYTAGAYTLNVTNFDGAIQRFSLNVPNGNFLQFPSIQNIGALANHPATADLTVSWLPWTNATANDFIRVELFDGANKVWDTASYSSPKHLTPDATYTTIPATNMIPGHIYDAVVHFYHVTFSDTRAIPGGFAFGGYDSRAATRFRTQPPDVQTISIAEGQYVWEHGDGVYEADPRGPFRFEATVQAETIDSVHSVQLNIPNKGAVTLTADASGQNFSYFASEPSATSLANDYPAGSYQFTFETQNDGARSARVDLLNNQLPPLPHIQNFRIFRLISFNTLPVTWDWWQGAETNTDSVILTVEKLSGVVVFQDSVKATHTNTLAIPGKTFDDKAPNSTYIARLRFERKNVFASADYPGVSATTTLFSEVAFYLTTLELGKFKASKSDIILTNGNYRFAISNLLAGRTYSLLFSRDLTNWTGFTQTMTNRNLPSLYVTNAPQDIQFFKAELLP